MIEDCSEAIENDGEYTKSYWRRAKAYEKEEKWYEAKTDYESVVEKSDKHKELAQSNLRRIEPLVQAELERKKDEMMGQLKGFANWGLGKLGLSLDNFKAQQDPGTGSYNIEFVQDNGNAKQ